MDFFGFYKYLLLTIWLELVPAINFFNSDIWYWVMVCKSQKWLKNLPIFPFLEQNELGL